MNSPICSSLSRTASRAEVCWRPCLALTVAAAILRASSAWAEPSAPSSLTYETVQQLGPYSDFQPTLTVGADGNVYGTTPAAVFRIDAAGTITTVHTFSEAGDPSRLVVGQDGFLYGSIGDFVDSAPPWVNHSVFFRLDYEANYTALALIPKGIGYDLIVGSDGAFYSATTRECYAEFCSSCEGIKITSAGAYALFGPEGPLPPIPLVLGSDGAVYGKRYVSDLDQSTIFRLDPVGNYTAIHQNTRAEGFFEALTVGSDGFLYGVNTFGGPNSHGAMIQLTNSGNPNWTHHFNGATEGSGIGVPIVGSDGALYGNAGGGVANSGTVYRVDTAGVVSVVHSFDWNNGGGGDPNYQLLLGKDEALYGVTAISVFRVDNSGTVTYPVIPASDIPLSSLVQANDCALYGVAGWWDPNPNGYEFMRKVFRVFEPGHLCQDLDFDSLPDRVLGDPPFGVTATASSGLPVSFTGSGGCSVTGDQVTLNGVGLCTVTASQAGDARYEPAAEVSQSFDVSFDFTGSLLLVGLAEGGAVGMTVAGIAVSVGTTAGQTPAQVVAALAVAINANSALQAMGVSATAVADSLITNGSVSNVSISDPGLSAATAVPALGAGAGLVLAALIAAIGVFALRGRRPSCGAPTGRALAVRTPARSASPS